MDLQNIRVVIWVALVLLGAYRLCQIQLLLIAQEVASEIDGAVSVGLDADV